MGEGSRAETREFPFIKDAKLREIIERDYKELSLRLYPGGAWKSTVIMAGSILEAILHDVLASDPGRQGKALASTTANEKPAKGKAMDEWSLHVLIKVAGEIGVLPQDREECIDRVLRDYRNFVHPKVEVKTASPCTEAEATLAKGGLDAVCNHLQATLK